MVRYHVFFVLLLISFFSCELLFQTPFPDELVLMGDSVPLEDYLGRFYESRIHSFNNYVFLTINEDDEADKCFVFTDELGFDDGMIFDGKFDTFATIDMNLNFVIGNIYFDKGNMSEALPLPDLGASGAPYDPGHPSNWGFSNGVFNFYLWSDDNTGMVRYLTFDSGWYVYSPADPADYTGFPGDCRLESLAFDQYDGPRVFLFFQSDDNGPHTVYIYTIPMGNFFTDNNGQSKAVDYTGYVEVHDVDVEHFFYTRAGFILKEHDGTYLRVGFDGKILDEMRTSMSDIAEAYDIDGENRYIFSPALKRIARTAPWWK
ncbi:MAG: hypothetical protein JW881_14435 [Spirochaetales bacterium]|nr:hypothetical protein [Spirochaetales bacterium]